MTFPPLNFQGRNLRSSSALWLILVCHLCHVLLRVDIFVLNVASYRLSKETNRIVHKNSFWEICQCKVVRFFTAQALLLWLLVFLFSSPPPHPLLYMVFVQQFELVGMFSRNVNLKMTFVAVLGMILGWLSEADELKYAYHWASSLLRPSVKLSQLSLSLSLSLSLPLLFHT